MNSIVMTTCGSEKEARRMAGLLLKGKLAACVKMTEVSSSYWWDGKVHRADESLLSVVAPKRNVGKVMALIKKVHSYDTPEIIEVPIRRGDKKYMRWVKDVTE